MSHSLQSGGGRASSLVLGDCPGAARLAHLSIRSHVAVGARRRTWTRRRQGQGSAPPRGPPSGAPLCNPSRLTGAVARSSPGSLGGGLAAPGGGLACLALVRWFLLPARPRHATRAASLAIGWGPAWLEGRLQPVASASRCQPGTLATKHRTWEAGKLDLGPDLTRPLPPPHPPHRPHFYLHPSSTDKHLCLFHHPIIPSSIPSSTSHQRPSALCLHRADSPRYPPVLP